MARSLAVLPLLCVALGLALADEYTIEGYFFVDNWFRFFFNGKYVGEDTVKFIPHNAMYMNFTTDDTETGGKHVYAVEVFDWADSLTGLEYNNLKTGDGGFIGRFTDGAVTNEEWKCMKVMYGPTDTSCLAGAPPYNDCRVEYYTIPDGWYEMDYDDSDWDDATLYTLDDVGWGRPPTDEQGLDPRDVDFGDADFIWSDDLVLDNTVLCRYTYYIV